MAMMEPIDPRRAPITPQLALRVAILGGIALALFAVVFLRLWYLQVLTGDSFRQQALNNRVRHVPVAAPRGSVLDRNGRQIVVNRVATVVQLDPKSLPAADRDAINEWGSKMTRRAARAPEFRGPRPPRPQPTAVTSARLARLAPVLGTTPAALWRKTVTQLVIVPYANVRLKVDVPDPQRNYLLERERAYPGIAVERIYLRRYPYGETAAQLVGSVGQINADQLKAKAYRGIAAGTVIGQEGIETAYDTFLRGTDGVQSITIDASGRRRASRISADPVPGKSLRTAIDLPLQRTGQRALNRIIAGGPGKAGAFVALDPRNGEVLAMGSAPSFDPRILASPISPERYDALFNTDAAPKFNRAISGLYATGSTFKPITALAALDHGLVTPATTIVDNGCMTIGADKQERCNAKKAVNGPVDLRRAMQVSSDIYFYTLGLWANRLQGQVIQTWARRLGLGRPTGIDLPGEAAGTIPDKAWRRRIAKKELAYEAVHHNRCPPDCVYSDKRPWTVGDNVSLAVGQGDVQATPLQMAVAYAALANGGRIVRPHLGLAIEDDAGRQLQRLEGGRGRRVTLDPAYRAPILDGLHLATIGDGTSAPVFRGWRQSALPLYGKTGTAQYTGRPDQSWYVAFVKDGPRPLVVAATVEDGGFGAEAAAPVACRMLNLWFRQKAACTPGTSATR